MFFVLVNKRGSSSTNEEKFQFDLGRIQYPGKRTYIECLGESRHRDTGDAYMVLPAITTKGQIDLAFYASGKQHFSNRSKTSIQPTICSDEAIYESVA